jgi:hypothetical protein
VTSAERTCLRAAQILRERGWCQLTMERHGRVCAVQALILAGREAGDQPGGAETHGAQVLAPFYREAVDLARSRIPAAYGHLTDYNDDEGRTAEEVVALLEGR